MKDDVPPTTVTELTPDLGYRSKITAVEPYGVDAIPDSERHGKAVSQFFIWFAAGMNFPIMVLGFAAVSMGLSLMSAVTAILAGSLVGAIVMGILSRMGGRLGVAQQIQARGPLGFYGNFIPVAYINVFAGIGWAAVTVILGAQAAHALVPAIPYWLAALVLVTVQLVVAIYGYNMIHDLQRILAVVLCIGFLTITVVSVVRGYQGAFGGNPEAPYYVGSVGGWVTFAGFFLSFLIAWWPFASDYSRYLPDQVEVNRAAGVWTAVGNFVSLSWLGIAGAILGGSAATGESPIEALHRLTGPFAVPALLTVLVSSFSQNFLNVYGGAISIQTLRIPVRRRTAVIFICAVAFLISLWAD
ncbi:MAG TPA: cytosine permease, partial [Mycobacterium sp.]